LGLLYNYPNPLGTKGFERGRSLIILWKSIQDKGEVSAPWIASWKINLFQLTWVGEWTMFGENNS
jgi:hypothetical protein